MNNIKTVAVYLGSRPGNDPKFVQNAHGLGRLLAENHIDIVYGGASVGTMKALADGALDAGGKVVGVFPTGFKGKKDNAAAGIEVGPKGLALSQLIEVHDLPERDDIPAGQFRHYGGGFQLDGEVAAGLGAETRLHTEHRRLLRRPTGAVQDNDCRRLYGR